ncbi:MAG: 3-deoxy-8-phosphooctulonate synthase [Desulfobulbaceae bacterium]|nr:MAG: 3-deoxy-8-phosphooctulonate synthase [Desulfobulbaceae bacterium]
MTLTPVSVSHPTSEDILVGTAHPLLLIAGPCVLESEELARRIAGEMKEICTRQGVSYVFKASFDKANRTSISSFRGPGLTEGLEILSRIREEMHTPVISDIHEPAQAAICAEVLDIIQVPAFLCRQTDLLAAASKTGKPINLKKGQFVSPWDMAHAVGKIRESGTSKVMLVERGASFGYNNLVVDMRAFPVMRSFDCPVIYDATHSVQLPGGAGGSSDGQREFIEPLSRSAVAAGVDGIFMEVHPEPENALCDGPNSIALNDIERIVTQLVRIKDCLRSE